MNSWDTCALVPLRGGSKGIPKKNIKLIAGKPLCAWVLEAAVQSSGIEKVFVSTDSREIQNVVESLDLGVQVIERPASLATDTASTESVMLHFASIVQFERLVTVQATCPLTKAEDLDMALNEFYLGEYDSLLSVYRSHLFLWNDNGTPINYNPGARPRRQEWNGTCVENGAFYITSSNVLHRYSSRLGGNVGLYTMEASSSADIDTFEDFSSVEQTLRQRK